MQELITTEVLKPIMGEMAATLKREAAVVRGSIELG